MKRSFFFFCQLIFLFAFSEVRSETFVANLKKVTKKEQDGTFTVLPFSSPGLYSQGNKKFVIRNTMFGTQFNHEFQFILSDIPTMIEDEMIVYTTNFNEILHFIFFDIDNARKFNNPYNFSIKKSNPKYTALKLSKCVNGSGLSTVTDDKVNIFVGSLPAGGTLRRFFIESAEGPFLILSAGYYGISDALDDENVVIALKGASDKLHFFVLQFGENICENFVADLKNDAISTISDKIDWEVLASCGF